MRTFEPKTYGPACRDLLTDMPLCELGPATPHVQQRERLAALTPESIVAGRKVQDRQMALCCLSGLWLLHNFLDESHTLSQDIATVSGSYWHGIMHRREPDFGNAKYWFRRVGHHAIEDDLCQAARQLVAESPDAPTSSDSTIDFITTQTRWDAYRFIDLCEAAYDGRSNASLLCRQIAQLEWKLLFDNCFHAAVGE